MISIWMRFHQSGKVYYLSDQHIWVDQIVLQQAETGWAERVVFTVRSLDGNWYLGIPEGFSWADKHEQQERNISHGDKLSITSKFGDMVLVVGRYQRENTVFTKYTLPLSGRLNIGRDAANDLCLADQVVSARHGSISRGAQNALVYTDTSENGSYVNGMMVKGSSRSLQFGDRVDIPHGLRLIVLGNVIAINNPAALVVGTNLKPLPVTEKTESKSPLSSKSVYTQYHRSPRRLQKPNETEIAIDAPLQMANKNDTPAWLQIGPSMTMVLPMATMALFLNRGIASIVMVGTSAVVAVFWSIMNRKHSDRKWEKDEALRLSVCRQYYEEVKEKLNIERTREKERLMHSYLSSQECINLPSSTSHRLWERMPSHQDFLILRLGVGERPLPLKITIPKEKLSLQEDPLQYEAQRLLDGFSVLRDVPITVDAIRHRLIGILGNERTPWVMQNLAVQAAANHSYHDVRLVVLYKPENKPAWEWTKWLPHVFLSDDRSLRMVVSEPAMVKEVLSRLDTIFSIRQEAQSENQQKQTTDEDNSSGKPYTGEMPYYILFVTDPSLIESHPISRYIAFDNLGFSLVVQAPSRELLPKECNLIIESKAQLGAIYTDEGDVTGTQFDLVAPQQLDHFARLIAPYRVQDSQGNAAIPSYLTFLDVYRARDVMEMDIWRYWNENKTYEAINSYIGFRAGNQPFALNIKFGANGHGPHGLLAGTTGSGKSVLLQSLILSLAVNYAPRDVQFVLIDYKGGGTSEVFRTLPHVVGIIDNLQGERAIYRALASIDGEIKRRQALFKAVEGGSISDIDDYIKLAEMDDSMEKLSHLVVVIDEFAELKTDQPEFMASMVKAARVGRSAGIHLMLATQTPSGSVSEEIKANTNFRICLRVADTSESRYMLNRPEAAYLRGMGRAYVQVGNDEIFELVQTSFSGAVYDPLALTAEEEPRILNEAGMPIVLKRKRTKGDSKRAEKQLDAVLRHINQVMALHQVQVPAKLWHDRLPFALLLETLPDMRQAVFSAGHWLSRPEGNLTAPIALADNIAIQKYDQVMMDFTLDKNFLVIGLSGSGKTTLLQTLALSLVLRYNPGEVNLYAFSLTGGMLRSLSSLPHVGDVVLEDQLDEQIRLVDILYKEDARRKALMSQASSGSFDEYNRLSLKHKDKYEKLPAIVVLVDRAQQVREWEELKRKEGQDKLYELLQTGSSRGIYFVLTALSANELPMKYQAFVKRIALQLNDRSDYMDALNVRIPADEWNGVDISAGRGMVATEQGVMEMQVALFGSDQSDADRVDMIADLGQQMSAAWQGKLPVQVPRIPESPWLEDLLQQLQAQEALIKGNILPMGWDKQTAGLFVTDLTEHPGFLAVGATKSGKTTWIKSMASTLADTAGAQVYLVGETPLCHWGQALGMHALTPTDPGLSDQATAWLTEATRRRGLVRQAQTEGPEALRQAVASLTPMLFAIDNVDSLIATADKPVLDALAELAGDGMQGLGLYFIATISHGKYRDNSSKQPLQSLVRQKRGLMLQGRLNDCDPFNANVPYSMKSLSFPVGEALYMQDGIVTHLVMPMWE